MDHIRFVFTPPLIADFPPPKNVVGALIEYSRDGGIQNACQKPIPEQHFYPGSPKKETIRLIVQLIVFDLHIERAEVYPMIMDIGQGVADPPNIEVQFQSDIQFPFADHVPPERPAPVG